MPHDYVKYSRQQWNEFIQEITSKIRENRELLGKVAGYHRKAICYYLSFMQAVMIIILWMGWRLIEFLIYCCYLMYLYLNFISVEHIKTSARIVLFKVCWLTGCFPNSWDRSSWVSSQHIPYSVYGVIHLISSAILISGGIYHALLGLHWFLSGATRTPLSFISNARLIVLVQIKVSSHYGEPKDQEKQLKKSKSWNKITKTVHSNSTINLTTSISWNCNGDTIQHAYMSEQSYIHIYEHGMWCEIYCGE